MRWAFFWISFLGFERFLAKKRDIWVAVNPANASLGFSKMGISSPSAGRPGRRLLPDFSEASDETILYDHEHTNGVRRQIRVLATFAYKHIFLYI